MKITKKWLEKVDACQEGRDWFNNQKERDGLKVLNKLIKEDRLDWANWAICRAFNYKQKIQYAVFAAEQVLDIFESKYPNDKRPREAIEAAKKCIKNPSKKNRDAAYAAANAAAYEAYAANAANAAANEASAAANAASAAANAAAYEAYAANAAYAAANAAAYEASAAANAATKKEMKIKILQYGIKLLK